MFLLVPGLILLTASAVTAFFVFFTASKATGRLKTFGTVLGFWVLLMGALAIVLATVGAVSGRHHFRGHRGHYGIERSAPPAVTPESVAPAR
jgi:hypothetical protein